jgi:hypothetical protein
MAVQFGGPIGAFPDHVQQRDVDVKVLGELEYMSNNPQVPEQWITSQVLQAVKNVIGAKMMNGQLTFRHLGTGQIGMVIPEIIQTAGLEQHGVRIGNITMRFVIDGHAPAPQQQQQQPQQQQQQGPQHVVEARIHVAGLNINASSDGGLDTQGLQNQLRDKAKSNIIWYGIGCGILFVVGLGILGLGLYIWHSTKTAMESSTSSSPSTRSATAAKWDGKSEFTCGGTDAVTLNGVKASAGITAMGNCQLTLVDCDITAATPIDATGNAQVTMTGGSLNGSSFAVKANGLAKVTLTGTKVTGKTKADGLAKITGP